MVCIGLVLGLSAEAAPVMSLVEAEQQALANDDGIKQLMKEADAWNARSQADDELPDPKLVLAARNLPTDSFNLSQEPMTQLVVGIRQQFPAGDSLRLKSEVSMARERQLRAQLALRKRTLVLDIRRKWLDAVYWQKAAALIAEQEAVYAKLEKVTRSLYQVGRKEQQDVLQVQVLREQARDRQLAARERYEVILRDLARWVPQLSQGWQPDTRWPAWGEARERDMVLLRSRLVEHPMLQASEAMVLASKKRLLLEEQSYKPGWNAGFSYGSRSGNNATGEPRSDFVSLDFSIDLPLFTANRQDKRVLAQQNELSAAQFKRDDTVAWLRKRLEETVERLGWLDKRVRHYDGSLLVSSQQHVEAAMSAYQRDAADFSDPMIAYDRDLKLKLDRTQLAKERLQTIAQLKFLTGDE
jgi:outer membrane protein TolC